MVSSQRRGERGVKFPQNPNNVVHGRPFYRRSADIYRPYAALVDRKTRNHVENWISYDASRTRINLETYGIPSLEDRPKDIAWIGIT